MADLYKILQVDPKADPEVIDAAYRRLARKLHPDVNPAHNATERMTEINAAYYVLRDGRRRIEYDRKRTTSRTVHATAPTARAHRPASTAADEGVAPTEARRPVRSRAERQLIIAGLLAAALMVFSIVAALRSWPEVVTGSGGSASGLSSAPPTQTAISTPTAIATPTPVTLIDAPASKLVLQPSDAPRGFDVVENHQWGDNDPKSWITVFHLPVVGARDGMYITSYVQILSSIDGAKEQFRFLTSESTKQGYQSYDVAADVGAARYGAGQVALHDLLRLGDESASLIWHDSPSVHRQLLWRDRNVLAMIIVDAAMGSYAGGPTSVAPNESAWWRVGTLARKQQTYVSA